MSAILPAHIAAMTTPQRVPPTIEPQRTPSQNMGLCSPTLGCLLNQLFEFARQLGVHVTHPSRLSHYGIAQHIERGDLSLDRRRALQNKLLKVRGILASGLELMNPIAGYLIDGLLQESVGLLFERPLRCRFDLLHARRRLFRCDELFDLGGDVVEIAGRMKTIHFAHFCFPFVFWSSALASLEARRFVLAQSSPIISRDAGALGR